VDTVRPQRNRVTKEHHKTDLEKEMGTAGLKKRKTEVAAQDRTG